jgi:hypothetical protein
MYSYTDSGAPVLSGQQGVLKDLLKKLLVGTAGVAYGTGINEKASLGWTTVYDVTDRAIFQGAAGASGMLFRVDDSGSGASSYREAFVFGCESATTVDAVTDRFPTAAQLAAGLVWRKSQNLSSTAVPWWAWGDSKTFYIMINWFGTQYAALYGFGDFVSHKGGDSFNAFVLGGTLVNTSGRRSTRRALTTARRSRQRWARRSHTVQPVRCPARLAQDCRRTPLPSLPDCSQPRFSCTKSTCPAAACAASTRRFTAAA